MPKQTKINDDLFDIVIHASVGGTPREAVKRTGISDDSTDVDELRGFVVADGRKYHIWLGKLDPAIFMHEFTHLVNAIYREHGASVSLEHDELDARWRGRLAGKIWNALK